MTERFQTDEHALDSRIESLGVIANRLRRHSVRMTSAAGSGHPTSCLSAADLVAAVFFGVLRYDVRDPDHPDNDRFLLSKGHAAPLLYAAWAEAGAIPTDFLTSLRQIDSELEGHPTPRFPWVEVGTGSLGQGLSVGLGMARSMKLEHREGRVFVLLGDGEVMEGSIWEAVELAPRLGVDNLIAIVDVNRLGQSDPTALEWDLLAYARRFEAFGWNPLLVEGHDIGEILTALRIAEETRDRPSVILARTVKGKGVSFLEDASGRHGKPLEGEEFERALAEIPESDPVIEPTLRPTHRQTSPTDGDPGSARAERAPGAWSLSAPDYDRGEEVATRKAFGSALARIGELEPRLMVLDGDVKNSTGTEDFLERFPDRFIEGFIAEQNLVGMALGLQALGQLPVVSTFACFLTRAFDQIRMGGISQAKLVLSGSHAGVSIGEDGPSQMGLEDIAMMRTVPGSAVLYPCDAVSAERTTELALRHEGIAYLRTTRPKTPTIYDREEVFELGGFKVIGSSPDDRLTIVGAGVTLHEAIEARAELERAGIPTRVIDLYGVKPLAVDSIEAQVRETDGRLLTVEDHYRAGGIGEALAAALAPRGLRVQSLAVDRLPRSGEADELMALMRIDATAIIETAREML